MALLAVGAALMIAFGLALSLQWGLLAAIVHHMARGEWQQPRTYFLALR